MVTPNPGEQNQERLLSEAIARRRATPSFDGSPVPDKVLSTIVHAGIEAPNGFKLQPWRFIVVRDADQKRRLREAAMGQAKVEEAGAVIVCPDSTGPTAPGTFHFSTMKTAQENQKATIISGERMD